VPINVERALPPGHDVLDRPTDEVTTAPSFVRVLTVVQVRTRPATEYVPPAAEQDASLTAVAVRATGPVGAADTGAARAAVRAGTRLAITSVRRVELCRDSANR
jgi:hypothetical protein